MKPAACPNCGKVNDCVGGVFDKSAVPAPGDIVMCIGCGHLAAYENPRSLRDLTAAELMEVMQDPEIQRAQLLRRMF